MYIKQLLCLQSILDACPKLIGDINRAQLISVSSFWREGEGVSRGIIFNETEMFINIQTTSSGLTLLTYYCYKNIHSKTKNNIIYNKIKKKNNKI